MPDRVAWPITRIGNGRACAMSRRPGELTSEATHYYDAADGTIKPARGRSPRPLRGASQFAADTRKG